MVKCLFFLNLMHNIVSISINYNSIIKTIMCSSISPIFLKCQNCHNLCFVIYPPSPSFKKEKGKKILENWNNQFPCSLLLGTYLKYCKYCYTLSFFDYKRVKIAQDSSYNKMQNKYTFFELFYHYLEAYQHLVSRWLNF